MRFIVTRRQSFKTHNGWFQHCLNQLFAHLPTSEKNILWRNVATHIVYLGFRRVLKFFFRGAIVSASQGLLLARKRTFSPFKHIDSFWKKKVKVRLHSFMNVFMLLNNPSRKTQKTSQWIPRNTEKIPWKRDSKGTEHNSPADTQINIFAFSIMHKDLFMGNDDFLKSKLHTNFCIKMENECLHATTVWDKSGALRWLVDVESSEISHLYIFCCHLEQQLW